MESESRRHFIKTAAVAAGSTLLTRCSGSGTATSGVPQNTSTASGVAPAAKADYTLHIRNSAIELAPDRIIGVTSYNGQFPGPLVRLKEGQPVTIDIVNETDTPEQLHWHGQRVSMDVDGAAEEGTPFIAAHGMRRISFTPQPAGLRFYHTHLRAGANLAMGQYSGQVGPVYIEPKREPGQYDREVFLVLKEFEPTLSRGGDVAMDFLEPSATIPALKSRGEAAMRASLAKGMPHGYEVGYGSFTINGRMLGHGEPIRVMAGERVLFHVLNGSATEIRSLALPGHRFRVIALDGNPVPNQADVPALWLGTGERVSAVVEMTHPGVWVLGDLSDDDRQHGMGVVVEYAGRQGKAQWAAPPRARWDYLRFTTPRAAAAAADETIEMTFAKDNASEDGFNRWTINGTAYPMSQHVAPASVRLTRGRRYRIRMRNESDDIHPIHLHRHTFEIVRIGGRPTAGILKDVLMIGGYQEAEVQFVADNPGLTLFHCHQQLHMDFGFMTLFQYT
jgi:FtsP/CotA-like multicopper oxidase with cupredoxin domain